MAERNTNSAGGITVRLTCMTYNIHSGVGVDKRYDLARIRRVIADEQPHVAALQELDCRISRSSGDDQAGALAGGLALTSSYCSVRAVEQGSFGNGVLSPFPVLQHQ